jgi:hypothetical protein
MANYFEEESHTNVYTFPPKKEWIAIIPSGAASTEILQ